MQRLFALLLASTLGACSAQAPPPSTPSTPAPTPKTPAPASAAPAPVASPASTSPPPLSGSGAPPAKSAEKVGIYFTSPSIDGRVTGAYAVIEGLRGDFAGCYAGTVAANPKANGKVMLVLDISKDGSVSGTHNSSMGDVSADVVSCLEASAKKAKFSPPPDAAIIAFGVTLMGNKGEAPAAPAPVTTTPNYKDAKQVEIFVRAKARECYVKALRGDPHLEGDVTVAVAIDDKGMVSSVTATPNGSLAAIPACIEKAAHAQFKSGPASLIVPVHLSTGQHK